MKKNLLCFGGWLLLGTVAHAGVIVACTSNCPQGNEQNILFTTSQTGPLVFGFTNQTHTQVDFSSTTDILNTPSNGQAKLTASDGDINNLTINVPNKTFADFIFDAEMGKLSKRGSLTLTADALTSNNILQIVNLGTFNLGTGSNFFTIVANNQWSITQLTINSSYGISGLGFETLKQPRISGISGTIPEPASLPLLGAGLFSFFYLLKRNPHQGQV
jgi:hypothetical protein